MAWDITFGIDATPELIRVARKAIYAMACSVGATEVDARDIELAAAEALRYAYEHAYHATPGRIDLSVGFHGTHFTVAVRDHAPRAAQLPSLPESLPEGSQDEGLYVARKLTDESIIEPAVDGPGTVVRLVKRVHWEPAQR